MSSDNLSDKGSKKRKKHAGEDSSDSYQFVQEKIKERPINKKKLLRRTIITAAMALIFGMIACVTFFSMEPIISNWLYPEEEPAEVTFPEEIVETMPEDMIQTEEEVGQNNEEDEPEPTQAPPPESVIIYETVELTLDDYVGLQEEMAGIAREAQRFMVLVTGVSSDVDWFNDVYESGRQTSGVIVANNGLELLILAKDSGFDSYQELMVTFHDGSVVEAEKKQEDPNTGLCILGVALNHISEGTMEDLAIAFLGSSSATNLLGTTVIALGSPGGASGSVLYGRITSNSTLVNMLDVNYRLLTTDIYGSREATGVLINLNGQVIGIIENAYNASGMENQISAIGITELKRTIETISNEREQAYLGIYGTEITIALSESMEMPRGVYVRSFEMDSPAMVSGIQSSDIITGIDESPVFAMADIAAALARCRPGDTVTIILQRRVQESYREMEIEVTLGILE